MRSSQPTVAATPLGPWRQHFPHWDLPESVAAPLADVLSPGPRDAAELAFALAVESRAKAELHVHMEAAVPAAFYERLNAIHQRFAPADMPARRAPFPTFRQFLRAWLDNCSLIESETLFHDLASAFVALRAKSNIRYSEAHISPFDFSYGRQRFKLGGKVLDFRRTLDHYLSGLRSGLAAHPGIEVRLIVDITWPSTVDEHVAMLDAVATAAQSPLGCSAAGEPLIVAIGLGGPELPDQLAGKVDLAQRVRALGLKLDVHSGEDTDDAVHRRSVAALRPDRVAHGIAPAARPEPAVGTAPTPPARFYERGVAACPTSNLLTGAFAGPLCKHPITAMLTQGTPVCVNTDDPLLFGTTLTLEFVALRRALHWDLAQVDAMTERAVAMAFAPAAARRAMDAANASR